MCFQRSSEGIEGKSRPPQSGWKIVPQSRTAAAEKLMSPNLLCVRGTSSFRMSLEWDFSVRRPASDRRWQSSARYAAASPSTNFFADSCGSAFYFNLFPSSKNVRLAWKQHILMAALRCGIWRLTFLSKTYFRIWCKSTVKPCIYFQIKYFYTD